MAWGDPGKSAPGLWEGLPLLKVAGETVTRQLRDLVQRAAGGWAWGGLPPTRPCQSPCLSSPNFGAERPRYPSLSSAACPPPSVHWSSWPRGAAAPVLAGVAGGQWAVTSASAVWRPWGGWEDLRAKPESQLGWLAGPCLGWTPGPRPQSPARLSSRPVWTPAPSSPAHAAATFWACGTSPPQPGALLLSLSWPLLLS